MSIYSLIKKANKTASSGFIETQGYWLKSPSSILFRKNLSVVFSKYFKNKNVLDAGAGRLAYRGFLKEYVKRYTSSDFTQTHPELDVVCNIEKMTFKNSSFDGVLCSQVLEHVPHPQKALKEINRILKKNGIAIITVPMLGYIHNAPYDFFRYTSYGLKVLSKEASFEVLELREMGGFFSFLGYVRSTALLPIFHIPFIGGIFLITNYLLSQVDIFLDFLTKNHKIFPLNYLLILRKK